MDTKLLYFDDKAIEYNIQLDQIRMVMLAYYMILACNVIRNIDNDINQTF